jgi:hypothetical protein
VLLQLLIIVEVKLCNSIILFLLKHRNEDGGIAILINFMETDGIRPQQFLFLFSGQILLEINVGGRNKN